MICCCSTLTLFSLASPAPSNGQRPQSVRLASSPTTAASPGVSNMRWRGIVASTPGGYINTFGVLIVICPSVDQSSIFVDFFKPSMSLYTCTALWPLALPISPESSREMLPSDMLPSLGSPARRSQRRLWPAFSSCRSRFQS